MRLLHVLLLLKMMMLVLLLAAGIPVFHKSNVWQQLMAAAWLRLVRAAAADADAWPIS